MAKKEEPDVKDRRALLKSLVAGSAVVTGSKALPEQWSKPLTDAVMLPTHAATTGDKYIRSLSDAREADESADDDAESEDGVEDYFGGDFFGEGYDDPYTGDEDYDVIGDYRPSSPP